MESCSVKVSLGFMCRNTSCSGCRFPKEAERRQRWLAAAQRDEGSLRTNSYMCSRHFEPSCFTLSEGGQLTLSSDAVPTIAPDVVQEDEVRTAPVRHGCVTSTLDPWYLGSSLWNCWWSTCYKVLLHCYYRSCPLCQSLLRGIFRSSPLRDPVLLRPFSRLHLLLSL